MSKYEKPVVQFHPRNKTEARQWKRDRNQLRFERNWKRTSRTENPLNGKKIYNSPKAEIYESSGLRKKSGRIKGSSYRSVPKFGSVLSSLVSMVLLIGIIGAVFVAFDNSNRKKGEAFLWFSPSNYFINISSTEVVISDGFYTVYEEFHRSFLPFQSYYKGYIVVDGKKIEAENKIYSTVINDPNLTFAFIIDGVVYKTASYEVQGPSIEGQPLNDVIRKVYLPETVYNVNDPPDREKMMEQWSNIENEKDFFLACGESLVYTGDCLEYYSKLLFKLLPWNSVVTSVDPWNGVDRVSIPWRNAHMEPIV